MEWTPRTPGQLRVVGAIRLSKYTDASTSPEVQEEMIAHAATQLGGTVVGWAVDTDVSALKTTPWEREELRLWLDNPGAWDVMVWQRMDRAVRSMSDMADLGRYAKQNRKRLAFAAGPGGGMLELDFTSIMSEFMMMFLAFAAQLEGQTIMERNQGAAAHLRSMGRWSGGSIPYGFMRVRKVFSDGREGWWLTLHSDTAKIRLRAMAMIMAGRNYSDVWRWLVTSKAITPKNHQARMADPPRPENPDDEWSLTTVWQMLRSHIVRGHVKRRDGTLIRHPDGSPILHADPMVDEPTWFVFDAALKRLEVPHLSPRRKDGHELLGVAVCGTCERNMHGSRARTRRSRKNGGSGEPVYVDTFRCYGELHEAGQPAFSINRAPVLELVEERFLTVMGRHRRTQVVRTPGVDNTEEIQELESDVADLSGRLVRLRGPAADAVESQVQGLSDRLEELRRRPIVPPRDEVVELDTTWADDWRTNPDWTARRQMLLDVGARLWVHAGNRWTPREDRLKFEIGLHVDPEQDDLDDVAYQETL